MQRQHEHRLSPVLTPTSAVPDSSDAPGAVVGAGQQCNAQASIMYNTIMKQKTDARYFSVYDPMEGPSNMILKHPGLLNQRKDSPGDLTINAATNNRRKINPLLRNTSPTPSLQYTSHASQRFEEWECVVPSSLPGMEAQQVGGTVRHVIPHAVDGESPSAAVPTSPCPLPSSRRSSTSHISNDSCLALQWNIRGLRSNISEIKQLLAVHDPIVVALQETKTNERIVQPNFLGENYTLLLESGNRNYWQHGVGIAIRSGTPFERVQIDCNIHAIAARIHLPLAVTVVCIYVPPNTPHCRESLNDFFEQLASPVLILGDFNAHHPAWGSQTTSTLGRFIAEKTLTKQLVVMNDSSATRIDPRTGTISAIDLSICSESIANRLTWNVLPDTHNSDHFPILVSIHGWSRSSQKRRRWLYDRANWIEYERRITATILPGVEIGVDAFAAKIIAAANASIPRTSGKVGPKAVPWWCTEVKQAVKRRRKSLRTLRRMHPFDAQYPLALRNFQLARTTARAAINTAKQKTWKDFVERISPHSTTAELWGTANILRGKRQHRNAVLKLADGFTDTPEDVAEELAKHYHAKSATVSYSPLFQMAKEKAESVCIDISPDTDDPYNANFTMSELMWALDRGRSVSSGPDMIGYPMLRRLPFSVKSVLLELFNRIWCSGVFPTTWRNGVVVPIPKANASDAGPASFRPITLTSCVAKLFERMVNRRLTNELETQGRLDKRQHAFRSSRGTHTYFAELERLLPNAGEHTLIASLDLSRAYDTTWRYGVLRTLKQWHIQGRMYNIIRTFLAERSFQVSVGTHLSRPYILENGTPQGSVLSVTLFLVAVQPVFGVVSNNVGILLYADDILLAVREKKEQMLDKKLQTAINAVDKWAQSVGFSIAPKKSYLFYCSLNVRREPKRSIVINKVPIPKTNLLKVLGVTIDRSLNFRVHCKQVKKACNNRYRLLQILGAKLLRAHRVSLLQIGSAIITTRLPYGIGLTSRGDSSNWQFLAPAYNRMVRYASGAFVTSPIQAIMVESGVLPFDLLALQCLVRLTTRLLEMDLNNRDLPIISRTSELLYSITGTRMPEVCLVVRSQPCTWYRRGPNIIWDIKNKVRAGDPPDKTRPIFQEVLHTRFQNYNAIYTDGSKNLTAVGAGVYGPGLVLSTSLPLECSVFSAEAYAIKLALTAYNSKSPTVVFTDSASCLSALESGNSRHPWIQQIELLVANKPVYFCWIPGHAGIRGNEEADRLARAALECTPEIVQIPGNDAVRATKASIHQHWNAIWQTTRDVKLREVKNDTARWTDCNNSADQRVLTRLRIGHTRLTHSFLLLKDPPLQCECCGTTLTVRHLLIECRKYSDIRKKYGLDALNLRPILLNDCDTEKSVILFLKECNLYSKL